MHAAVFADLEGSFGIWRMRQCRTGTAEWQYGRGCLTRDVNAVVAGAFDGGASRVTVKDTHDTGFNCLPRELHPRARYIGGHYTTPTFYGDVSGYDLILYVAIHAAASTPGAFFPHTHYGIYSRVLLNGRPACEMDVYGAYLGELGVPIGFVSGEAIAVDQALCALPWARGVRVDKKKETYTSGASSRTLLQEGRATLRREAALAVEQAATMKPLVLEGPLRFEVEFRSEQLANKYNTWSFATHGNTVTWEAPSMVEGFDLFNKLTFFPRRVYPFRHLLIPAMRTYYQVKNNLLAPRPNPEGAELA